MAGQLSWYGGFEWEAAPLSHWRWPALGVAAYLVAVAALSVGMRSRQGLQLKYATAAHNMLLSLGSLCMLLGTALEASRRRAASGELEWLFCESGAARANGPLYFWSYVYYLSKYYEMLDTVLVLLQKSRVPNFNLQVYHHAVVVIMAWLWGEQRQSLQWPALMFNCLVHVVMYQYYAWRVLGLPTPWKRWITKLQILQFVTSFVLVARTLYVFSRKTNGDTCAGMQALLFNALFNATLLLQFIGVDKRNAAGPKERAAAKRE